MDKNQLTIRPATNNHAEAIAEVRTDAVLNIDPVFYDQSALNEWAGPIEDRVQMLLSNSAGIRIVAETDGKIVGYGELVTEDNLLGACYVSPSAAGQGVGKGIVAELERIAREKGMAHLQMESSVNAEQFYLSCGYQVTDRGKHTMRSGAVMDCVMMRKDL